MQVVVDAPPPGFRRSWRTLLCASLTILVGLGYLPAIADTVSIKKVAAGVGFFLVLRTDAQVWAFGDCDHGKLWPLAPPGQCKEIRKPRPLDLPRKVMDIAASDGAAYVLFDDGTVMSWGSDRDGQLGTGPRYQYGRARPLQREPTIIPGLTNVVQIAAAMKVAAALTADGTVYWWGERPGDLPSNSANSATPVRIEGMPVASAIALGPTHLLAIAREDRAVYAVGNNHRGQLGTGTTTASNQALRVPGLPPAISVCAARDYSGTVLADGSVRTWGTKIGGNGPGSIAAAEDPNHGIDPVPVLVSGVSGAEKISCMDGVTGVVMKDRTLRLWGHDGWGQIGVGRAISEYQPKPMKPALGEVADLFVTGSRTFAVTMQGRLYFWGVGNTSYPEPMKTMKQRPTPYAFDDTK